MAGIEKARREMVKKRKLSELSDQNLVVTPVKKFKGPLYGTRLVDLEYFFDQLEDSAYACVYCKEAIPLSNYPDMRLRECGLAAVIEIECEKMNYAN